jgi:hypothetical protein
MALEPISAATCYLTLSGLFEPPGFNYGDNKDRQKKRHMPLFRSERTHFRVQSVNKRDRTPFGILQFIWAWKPKACYQMDWK